MDSTVRLRPSHYEVLGLTPDATDDQIARAFATEIGALRPRAFGSLAEVTVAYETLKDPTKRKAYDASLGLRKEPPSLAPQVKADLVTPLRATPKLSGLPAVEPSRPPRADPVPRPEPRIESKQPPFVAAPPVQPIEPPALHPRPKADELRRPKAAAKPEPKPEPQMGALQFTEHGRFHSVRHSPVQWKLPAIAGGFLLFAVGLGAWTGLEAGSGSETVTVKVPPAKPRLARLDPSPAPALAMAETEPEEQQSPAPPVPTRSARPRPPLQIDLPEEQPSEMAVLEQRQREMESQEAPTEAPAVTQASAKLPLPNAVIARTIGRIGYPCGQVASASTLSPGVFKVTCTSGHSYRASPVNGRYRFRRMSS